MACYSIQEFFVFHSAPGKRAGLGLGRMLGEDTARTAEPRWPKGYSTSHVMLSNKTFQSTHCSWTGTGSWSACGMWCMIALYYSIFFPSFLSFLIKLPLFWSMIFFSSFFFFLTSALLILSPRPLWGKMSMRFLCT